jgi:hypothetical protein
MKISAITLIICLFSHLSFGKVKSLKDYDFSKGDYSILGVYSESDQNSLRDSLGEFYTDDISILQEFQKEWVFKKPGLGYACGYHYTVYICKDGLQVERLSINLNCNEVATNEGYFYFDPEKLRMFYGKLKKTFGRRKDFSTISEARNYRNEILLDTNLVMTYTPEWTKFEGYFQFTYEFTDHKKVYKEEAIAKKLKELEAEIRESYPGEDFELSEAGGSLTEIFVEVSCNKTLSDKFNLFQRLENSSFGKWVPYQLTLKAHYKNWHQ